VFDFKVNNKFNMILREKGLPVFFIISMT
jgi:hypothetical protein